MDVHIKAALSLLEAYHAWLAAEEGNDNQVRLQQQQHQPVENDHS